MKSTILYIALFLSVFIFSSCKKDIEFNGAISAPLLIVNSYITPDSVVSAHVSESRFFLKDSITHRNVDNAEMAVWVNGTLKEKMTLTEKGMYRGTYIPAIGEIIKLIVHVPGRNELNSEALIYPRPEVNSLYTASVWTGKRYQISIYTSSTNHGPTVSTNDTIAIIDGHTIECTLKFNDNANEKNYYRLIVHTIQIYTLTDTLTHVTRDSMAYSYSFNFTDVVSGNNASTDPLSFGASPENKYAVFTDELFNGKTYPLTFSTDEDVYTYKPDYHYAKKTPDRKKIRIYLESISKDYYLYLKLREASRDVNFFSEQVQIHNNIVGGIGILGSYTPSNVEVFDL